MKKDKNTISANEINKFVYCNYQWYYEKIYTSKELRRLAKQRNEELGLYDETSSNFRRGLDYHKNLQTGNYSIKIILIVVFVLFILGLFWLYFGSR